MSRVHHTEQVQTWQEHLIRRAQAGDRAAVEILFDSYRGAVRAHAQRVLRDADDANDAVQETFVKALRGLATFDPARPFLPWLMRVCTNCCVDALRSRHRGGECVDNLETGLADTSDGADDLVQQGQRRQVVHEAVASLPERYRKIIFMRHFRHMDVSDIASELSKPEGTVKSWLFRARALLRKELEDAALA